MVSHHSHSLCDYGIRSRISLFLCFFVFCFFPFVSITGIWNLYFPNQGLNPQPLYWMCGILTPGFFARELLENFKRKNKQQKNYQYCWIVVILWACLHCSLMCKLYESSFVSFLYLVSWVQGIFHLCPFYLCVLRAWKRSWHKVFIEWMNDWWMRS